MKTKRTFRCRRAALALLSAFSLQPLALFGQGSLTPPGTPGPTMKTLAQIEPRTPIAAAPFTITAPGSYYLSSNLTVTSGDAITIAADGVTLDLGGFTIRSTAPSAAGHGILLRSNRSEVAILSGHIQGGVTNNAGTYSGRGFAYGISSSGAALKNTRVTGVSVSGCLYDGIKLLEGASTVVESCTVQTVGDYGIVASTIRNSVAMDCGGDALSARQVSDCQGESVFGDGIHAGSALNCTGISRIGNGVFASMALNCSGTSENGVGINASLAQNCAGESSSADGIYAVWTVQNCLGSSGDSGRGIYCRGSAENSTGNSFTGSGLEAATAQNCVGSSTNGYGVSVLWTAKNCYGASGGFGKGLFSAGSAADCFGTSASGTGLETAAGAVNCTGISTGAVGLNCVTALNCYGWSEESTGLTAEQVAQNCYGRGGNFQAGIIADIANSCAGGGPVLFPVSANYKYDMP